MLKGKQIGEGNTAEVFAWGDNEILKLFRREFPFEGIEREYQVNTIIGELKLPVPKAVQIIDIEDRRGIIYQKVTGASLMELIMKHPFSSSHYVKQLATLHYDIHKCRGLELPKYKESLEWNIRHTDCLTEDQKLAVLNLLEELSEGDRLCHGDFHPGNIMEDGDGVYILDWMTAAVGPPEADVARTVLLLKDSSLPGHIPPLVSFLIGCMRKSMAAAYLKHYLKLSGMQKEEIESWRLVIIAARLREWIPESEKKAILKEIERTIRR